MDKTELGQKIVVVDLSRAYLLARMTFEARKVIYDDWLSEDRRYKAAVLYHEVGTNFNGYITSLKNVKNPKLLYELGVGALQIFRDNLDLLWCYAYSGNLRKLIFLPKITSLVY